MSARLAVLLVVLLLPAACASKRPVLYPNRQLYDTGQEVAEAEIDRCLRLARDYGHATGPGAEVVGHTAAGSAVGAAVGGAAGAVVGHGGYGAAAGAAGGGVRGLLRGLRGAREPNPIERRFVEQCLREQGYQPIGWR